LYKSDFQTALTKLYIFKRFFSEPTNFLQRLTFRQFKVFVIAEKITEGEIIMKKFLALSLLLGSMMFSVSSVEAKNSVEASAAQQSRYYQNRRYNNQRTVRIVTRNVRRGRQIFRETYRVTYNNRNGVTRTRLVSRVRIR
jgi:hypothetical protein